MPSVRSGVQKNVKKMLPRATVRRANLAAASKLYVLAAWERKRNIRMLW